MMKIAVALFGTRVSPRFDCAPEFRIVEADNGEIIAAWKISTQKLSAVQRTKKLIELGINEVICGGIDVFSAEQLHHCGIRMYSWITGQADDAVDCWLRGELKTGFMMAPGGRCCGRWRFAQRCRGGQGNGWRGPRNN